MNNNDLFLVLEHINDAKNNKYRALRAMQLSGRGSKNQLNLLEPEKKQATTKSEKTDLKIIH